jgi:hypothetical protein
MRSVMAAMDQARRGVSSVWSMRDGQVRGSANVSRRGLGMTALSMTVSVTRSASLMLAVRDQTQQIATSAGRTPLVTLMAPVCVKTAGVGSPARCLRETATRSVMVVVALAQRRERTAYQMRDAMGRGTVSVKTSGKALAVGSTWVTATHAALAAPVQPSLTVSTVSLTPTGGTKAAHESVSASRIGAVMTAQSTSASAITSAIQTTPATVPTQTTASYVTIIATDLRYRNASAAQTGMALHAMTTSGIVILCA